MGFYLVLSSVLCCMLVFILQSQIVTCFNKKQFSCQSAQTLIRSMNLFCFLWIGKPQTALKGATWAGIC